MQQFRTTITGETTHRWLVHDRDGIYAALVDDAVQAMGVRVLKTPARTPQANAFCEPVIGTMRRECLDLLIPLNERHVHQILRAWVIHYDRGRPHMSFGPAIPEPSTAVPVPTSGHHLPTAQRVAATAILSGLHH